jgi:Family of unknown function (DUF5522)
MEEEYYYQEGNGLMVFTEAYHIKRGFCCGCGCKHCPYEYEAVKEPRRSELKAKREMTNDLNDEFFE